jgi:hypothetical protein
MFFRTMLSASLALGLFVGGGAGCNCAPPADDPKPPKDAGTTSSFDGLGLEISDPAARSCELVVSGPHGAIDSVTFAEGVTGEFIDHGTRVGVAFFRTADEPIEAGSVELQVEEGAFDALLVAASNCFDAQGRLIEGATVALLDGGEG